MKVLIVEDEMIIAEDFKATLTEHGHEVVGVVSNGEDALATARRIEIDLAVVDLHLKGKLTGLETAELLLPTPSVLTTSILTPNIEDRVYLQKPFKSQELVKVIDAVCSRLHSYDHR